MSTPRLHLEPAVMGQGASMHTLAHPDMLSPREHMLAPRWRALLALALADASLRQRAARDVRADERFDMGMSRHGARCLAGRQRGVKVQADLPPVARRLDAPRAISGLLAGIGGPLSTDGRWLDLGGGVFTRASVQDTAPMSTRGAHIEAPRTPASATHASVEAEVRADEQARRLHTWTEAPASGPTQERGKEAGL